MWQWHSVLSNEHRRPCHQRRQPYRHRANARSMGGVGIAAPQDAISSVFANPACLCGPTARHHRLILRARSVHAPCKGRGKHATSTVQGLTSASAVYAIPAIGISMPITDKLPFWRFGIAAYGVTGLGVDYRAGISISRIIISGGGVTAPLIQGEYTSLQVMKFAPDSAFAHG